MKLFCSETAVDVVMRTLRVYRLAGYSESSPFSVARHLRDVLFAPLMVANDRPAVTNGGLQVLQAD